MRIPLAFGCCLSLLVASLLVITPVEAGDRPPPVSTAPRMRAISSLDMITASKGWGWGAVRVYRTLDGGAHFVDVTPPGLTSARPIMQLTASDALHAWILTGSPAGFGPSTLYRTTNGGSAWTRFTIPVRQAGQLTFIDPLHGWMQSGGFTDNHRVNIITLRRTADGGRTWSVIYQTRVRIPIEPNVQRGGCEWSSPAFSNAAHGVVGLTCDHSAVLRLALTNDGGKTWRRVTLPPFPHRKGRILSSMVQRPFLVGNKGTLFASLCIGTSTSCYEYGALYRTSDGGRTWHRTSTTIRGDSPLFADGMHVWLPPDSCVGSCPHTPSLLRTHDGGSHWAYLPLPRFLAPNLHGDQLFQFVTPSIGFAVITREFDPHAHFFRTGDGGRTWQVFYPRIIK